MFKNFFGLSADYVVDVTFASTPASNDRRCSASSLITAPPSSASSSSASSSANLDTSCSGFEPLIGCRVISELDLTGKLGPGDDKVLFSSVDCEFVKLDDVGTSGGSGGGDDECFSKMSLDSSFDVSRKGSILSNQNKYFYCVKYAIILEVTALSAVPQPLHRRKNSYLKLSQEASFMTLD